VDLSIIAMFVAHVRINIRPIAICHRLVHTIVCQDATNATNASIASVDCIFTDPPYCLLTRRQKDGTEKRKALTRKRPEFPDRFDDVKHFRLFTEQWLAMQVPVLKPTGVLVIWMNALGKKTLTETVVHHGFKLEGEYIWAKAPRLPPAHSTASEVNLRVYETAFVFTRREYQFDSRCGPGFSQQPRPWSVLTGYHGAYPSPAQGGGTGEVEPDSHASGLQPNMHPHHKPFACLDPLIRSWTRPGDVIYDPFAGSGSIPAAAARLGRVVHGGEIDPQWVPVANAAVERARAAALS
jgi:site-specific DNA-methyltransferase (adenine-specific)